jgi:hypothetical protein
MSRELESSYNMGYTSMNQGFNSASALQIRLDPTNVIENVELFLRGAKIVVEQDDAGNITTKRVTLGHPLANDMGIQGILNWLQMRVNPQVAQGNFAVDSPHQSTSYGIFIYFDRVDFSHILLENFYEWQLSENSLNLITDSIMGMIEPFMTRLIGNEERKSYVNTVTHNESNSVREGNKGWSLFPQGGK